MNSDRNLGDLLNYKESTLENIENSLNFENQKLKGKIIEKKGKYSCFGGASFLNSYRQKKVNELAQSIGQYLGIEQHIISESQLLYKLVQSKNWVQGRSTSLVILACLYIKCRQRETGHLMIDFSNAGQIDIFQLSKIYLKLSRFLHFPIKLNDPSIYVPRFLKQLNFPRDKEKDIRDYVLRLLSRMRKDWLGQGRRPTGLIAAGFYIACKCYGIQKNLKDIGNVLKVSEETIRKRVNEFKNLKVATLTQEEFLQLPNLDIQIEAEDPPSYKRKRQQSIEEKKQEIKQLQSKIEKTDDQIQKLSEIDKNIDDLGYLEKQGREIVLKNMQLDEKQLLSDDKQLLQLAITNIQNEEDLDNVEIKEEEFNEEDIEACLLKPYEVKIKTIAWNNRNKDWIKEQEAKKKIQQKINNQKTTKEKRKIERSKKIVKLKQKKVNTKQSHNEVVQSILQKSKLNNLNTSVLEQMFRDVKKIQDDKISRKATNQFF